jgi:hypothetical protein
VFDSNVCLHSVLLHIRVPCSHIPESLFFQNQSICSLAPATPLVASSAHLALENNAHYWTQSSSYPHVKLILNLAVHVDMATSDLRFFLLP